MKETNMYTKAREPSESSDQVVDDREVILLSVQSECSTISEDLSSSVETAYVMRPQECTRLVELNGRN